eukprot:2895779-Lingulodinium_polyedra.AAC.1
MGTRAGDYALNLQKAGWRDSSNAKEHELRNTALATKMPVIFSLCHQKLDGFHWRVLCVGK